MSTKEENAYIAEGRFVHQRALKVSCIAIEPIQVICKWSAIWHATDRGTTKKRCVETLTPRPCDIAQLTDIFQLAGR
jgi:hypothetical protein